MESGLILAYLLGLATLPVLAGTYWLLATVVAYLRFNAWICRQGWRDGIEPRLVSIVLAPYLGIAWRSGRGFGVRPPKWWRKTVFVPRPLVVADGWPAFHLRSAR